MTRKRLVALLAVGFLLLSPTTLQPARWAVPHSLYSAFPMAALFSLAKVVQTKNLRQLYGALIYLGLAFLTIKYGPLLLIVLLVKVFVQRRNLFPNWSRGDLFPLSLKSAAIPLLVIGAIWPAGLYKLSLLNSYGFFLYYTTIRNQAYGRQYLSHVSWTRIASSPLEYSLLLSFNCYLVYLLYRRRELLYLLPFFV